MFVFYDVMSKSFPGQCIRLYFMTSRVSVSAHRSVFHDVTKMCCPDQRVGLYFITS